MFFSYFSISLPPSEFCSSFKLNLVHPNIRMGVYFEIEDGFLWSNENMLPVLKKEICCQLFNMPRVLRLGIRLQNILKIEK